MSRPLALAAFLLAAMLLACTISIPMTGGISGSGNIVTLQEDITDFDRVVISYAFVATIRQADAFSVVIRVDDNLRVYVRVSKVGQTLEIGIDPNRVGSIRRGTLEAEVTPPALASLEANGASHLSYVGNPTLRTVDTSGSSTVEGE